MDIRYGFYLILLHLFTLPYLDRVKEETIELSSLYFSDRVKNSLNL